MDGLGVLMGQGQGKSNRRTMHRVATSPAQASSGKQKKQQLLQRSAGKMLHNPLSALLAASLAAFF
jgi:hypothetical protein